MKKFLALSILPIIATSLLSNLVLASPDGAVSKTNIESLVIGNTMDGKHTKKGFSYALYANPNGTLDEKRGNNVYPGKWNLDEQGRFCWGYDDQGKKWQGKTWCRWIIKKGNNEYAKAKDDGFEVREFKIVKGNSFAVKANKELSADEIKKLFTDKKFDGKNHDTGRESSNKAKADGKMYADVLMGPTWDIKWWVDGSGRHCLKHPKFGESCGKIIDNGDGSYTRIVEGKKANTYKRFR